MKNKITDNFNGNFKSFYSKYLLNIKPIGGNEYRAICPFHEDSNPSLSINNQTGQYFCHGCNKKGDIFHFYGKMNTLDTRRDFGKILKGIGDDFGIHYEQQKSKVVTTYDYRDSNNNLLFQVCRMEPKDFRQRRPGGNGRWVWNLKGVERVLYHLPEVLKAGEIVVVEGEKDADNLSKLGFTATTSPMGAGNWKPSYNKALQGKDVVLIPDNDKSGRKHAIEIAQSLNGTARSLKIINLPRLPEGGDFSDWLAPFADQDQAAEELSKIIDGAAPYNAKKDPDFISCLTSFNACDLMGMELPEPKWAIPDILPEGLNILAGKPKMGKSVLCSNIAVAITTAGKALGKIDVEKGAVLYLALEDTKRRLQSRLKSMLQEKQAPKNLYFETEWPRIDQDGIDKLDKRIQEIPDLRLVIIDTLKKIRPLQKDRNTNPYDIDYEHVAAIKRLADKHGIAILLVHHLRKTQSEDIMDDFSGTFGLTGAADGLLAFKRKTGQADAELHIVGRDVDAAEYALKYHPDIWTWELMGNADEVRGTETRQAIYDAIKEADEDLKPKDIAKLTGLKYRTVTKGLKILLDKGTLSKTEYGKYRIPAYL